MLYKFKIRNQILEYCFNLKNSLRNICLLIQEQSQKLNSLPLKSLNFDFTEKKGSWNLEIFL